MKNIIALCLSSISLAAIAAPANAQSCTPSDAQVSENTYTVLRKGKPIGKHVISFYGGGDAMKVVAKTKMKVEVAFITVFKYKYDSTEIFCGGTLESVNTAINNNGDKFSVRTVKNGADYVSETVDDGDIILKPPFHTSNHWDARVTNATGILNTATGKVDVVTFAQTVPGDIQTYAVRGDIDYDTQYLKSGQWIGMKFEHPKGGMIEFRCEDCNNTPGFALTSLATTANAVSLPAAASAQ